jgi:hypothetical protein
VEKYGRARQATDGNIIWYRYCACRITKATYIHSEYLILILHGSNGYTNVPQCYVYTYFACLVYESAGY